MCIWKMRKKRKEVISMKKIRGIALDNGGSEVRVLPVESESLSGMIKFDNDFFVIEEKDFRVKETDTPESVIRITKAF